MNIVQPSKTAYQNALQLERAGNLPAALVQFQHAAEEGDLLALLRLAQTYDQGISMAIDLKVAAVFYKRAAMASGSDEILRELQNQSPQDAVVFIALLAKAFLIASESGRFIAHAVQAWNGTSH